MIRFQFDRRADIACRRPPNYSHVRTNISIEGSPYVSEWRLELMEPCDIRHLKSTPNSIRQSPFGNRQSATTCPRRRRAPQSTADGLEIGRPLLAAAADGARGPLPAA